MGGSTPASSIRENLKVEVRTPPVPSGGQRYGRGSGAGERSRDITTPLENIAARIESFAIPGGVMLSDFAYDQIKNRGDVSVVAWAGSG